jgi:uncharacterized membrane protein
MQYKVNKWVDFLDRVGWTFLQSAIGAWAAFGFDFDWDVLKAALIAAAVAAGKVAVGQNVGKSPVGDVVPGASAVEPTTTNT